MNIFNCTIIIVNYNGKSLLKDCIETIYSTEASKAEIVVVDNSSWDGSVEYIKENFPDVRLIELDRNYGFAKANNIGVKNARGEYIVFLNNDAIVSKGWLQALLDVMSDNSIGVSGSKLLFYDFPEKINSAGANIVFNGGGYDIGFMEEDRGQYNITTERGAVCAASMMLRRDEFLRLGGFDDSYFMYFEDIDLCWRYWLSGYRVVYVPDSVVYHRFGGTTGVDRHTPLRVFYGTRNCLFNILKNYEPRHIIFPLLFNLFFHFLNFSYFILSLRIRPAVEIPLAYYSLLKNLPEIIKKRGYINKIRRLEDRYLFKKSVIVGLPAVAKEVFRLLKKGGP